DPGRQAAALSVRAADGEPRLPAGPPDHGADPVELVPALRPQPADVRAEHLLGETGRLPESRAADLPRSRAGELHRAAPRGGAVIRGGRKSSRNSFRRYQRYARIEMLTTRQNQLRKRSGLLQISRISMGTPQSD